MNPIPQIIGERLTYALGWTLAHSLWQAAAVALGLAFVLVLLRKSSSHARYLAASGALCLTLLLTVATFVTVYQEYAYAPEIAFGEDALPSSAPEAVSAVADAEEGFFVAEAEPEPQQERLAQVSERFAGYVEAHLPLIVTVWLMGMLILTLRFAGAYAYAQRLRHYRAQPAADRWVEAFGRLAEQAGLKRSVKVLESLAVSTPMVIGHLKPVVLLPAGMLVGLTPKQIEFMLAHELAHVRRADYLVNLMQSSIEILLFYHPAVWWISSQIDETREHCCDDIAIELTGDALGYARALATVGEMQTTTPSLSMAATGNGKESSLMGRVKRLFDRERKGSSFSEGFFVAILLICALYALNFNLDLVSSDKQLEAKLTFQKPEFFKEKEAVEAKEEKERLKGYKSEPKEPVWPAGVAEPTAPKPPEPLVVLEERVSPSGALVVIDVDGVRAQARATLQHQRHALRAHERALREQKRALREQVRQLREQERALQQSLALLLSENPDDPNVETLKEAIAGVREAQAEIQAQIDAFEREVERGFEVERDEEALAETIAEAMEESGFAQGFSSSYSYSYTDGDGQKPSAVGYEGKSGIRDSTKKDAEGYRLVADAYVYRDRLNEVLISLPAHSGELSMNLEGDIALYSDSRLGFDDLFDYGSNYFSFKVIPESGESATVTILDDGKPFVKQTLVFRDAPQPKVELVLQGRRVSPDVELSTRDGEYTPESFEGMGVVIEADESLSSLARSDARYVVKEIQVTLAKGRRVVKKANFKGGEPDWEVFKEELEEGERFIIEVIQAIRIDYKGHEHTLDMDEVPGRFALIRYRL